MYVKDEILSLNRRSAYSGILPSYMNLAQSPDCAKRTSFAARLRDLALRPVSSEKRTAKSIILSQAFLTYLSIHAFSFASMAQEVIDDE